MQSQMSTCGFKHQNHLASLFMYMIKQMSTIYKFTIID